MNLKGAKFASSLSHVEIILNTCFCTDACGSKVVSDSHWIGLPKYEPETVDVLFVSIAIKANDFFALGNWFRLPCTRISFKENVTGSSGVSELDSVDVLHTCHLDCNVCDWNRFALTMRNS